MQLDQQALNAVPGDERVGLEVTEDTSPAAQGLKAHSLPGKALPIIYLISGVLSLPSIRGAVQEMLRRHEYGGVVMRHEPTNIRNDLTAQADWVLVIRADGSMKRVRSTLVTEDFLKRVLNTVDNDLRLSFESIYVVTLHLEKRQKAFLSGQMNRPYGNERATSP